MVQVELKKWGNSLAVRLPKKVLYKAGIEGMPTTFDVAVLNGNITLMPHKPRPSSLKELFKGFDYKAYWDKWEKEHPGESKEVDWGKPVGKEIDWGGPAGKEEF